MDAEERKGEKIGGGFFVMRRGKKTGRVGVRSTLPFEHPSLEAAVAEAERLTCGNAGERFAVFQQVYVYEPVVEVDAND